jgi:hypothetical protein
MNERRIAILIAALISCGGSIAFARAPAEGHPITFNRAAFDYACELIAGGRVVADKKGSWRAHHTSRSEENKFIHNHGFAEYAKWHLGIDSRHSSQSKTHYKFPFGDFAALHRCGLLAAKARAHQSGYAEIEAAADQLLSRIEIRQPTR